MRFRDQLPSPVPCALNDHKLEFLKCRKYHGKYFFALKSGGVVTVLPGVPDMKEEYKAMSYVWGQVSKLHIPCVQCQSITTVPMVSNQRFNDLMELGGSGRSIWLDALSIDQSDHADVASTIKMMGSIYSNAKVVSVLLPSTDLASLSICRG